MKKAPENIMRCPVCKEPMVCAGGIVPWHKRESNAGYAPRLIICSGIGHAAEKLLVPTKKGKWVDCNRGLG